mmetsp:Transcript_29033/g.63553  ORF Transcript_29033/g.63553 Transcript_29033/m.63553 type:complete len:234 (-) Transcript_29033:784-1485(-)
MLACSNELGLVLSSWLTESRISGVIFRESKLRISSLTERLPRKRFIETHEVSKLPMMRSTPSRTSRIASGGILSERISFKLSDLMPPTALRACSRMGAIEASSCSTPPLRRVISASSLPSLVCRCSTSALRSTARCIDFWIWSIALSASSCFCESSARCSMAVLLSLSTSASASDSLASPPESCSTRSDTLSRCDKNTFFHIWQKKTYIRGVAPRASCVLCTATSCFTSGARW